MPKEYWVELSIPESSIPPNIRDAVTEMLSEECGGTEIVQDDETTIIKAYIAADDMDKASLTQIQTKLTEIERRNEIVGGTLRKSLRTRKIEQVDWATNWKQFYHPVRIGDHFVVFPSWEEPEDLQSGDKVIQLDPGQAFGTGQHETTTICMRFMESLPLEGWRIADVGCGSGILSIAATLLGSREVQGVDIDSVAVDTAQENLQKNGIRGNVHFATGSAHTLLPQAPFDLVIANIISDVLLDIGSELRKLAGEDGILIWSGIIDEQAQKMERYIASLGLHIKQKIRDGEWFGYLLATTRHQN